MNRIIPLGNDWKALRVVEEKTDALKSKQQAREKRQSHGQLRLTPGRYAFCDQSDEAAMEKRKEGRFPRELVDDRFLSFTERGSLATVDLLREMRWLAAEYGKDAIHGVHHGEYEAAESEAEQLREDMEQAQRRFFRSGMPPECMAEEVSSLFSRYAEVDQFSKKLETSRKRLAKEKAKIFRRKMGAFLGGLAALAGLVLPWLER
ncbi:MAG: hypothetical protein AAF191_12115 [Verrucomicrobiota bacterium]